MDRVVIHIAVLTDYHNIFDHWTHNQQTENIVYHWVGREEAIIGREFNALIMLYPFNPLLIPLINQHMKG